MTHGSLFSGIGGIDLGFEWAGIETKWQVEIDDYCQKLLSLRFPHTKKFTDVRKVGSHNLEKVDIISGGFPCQDISVAGKGAGLEGERSGLWTELHRVISELRPRFAFIENVPMLTIRGGSELLLTLPKSGMMQNGKLWEQTMWVRGTGEKESGSWPTPHAEQMGNTPETWDSRMQKRIQQGKQPFATPLAVEVQRPERMFPTPRVSDTEGGIVKNVELKDGSFSRVNKDGVRWGVKLKDAVNHLQMFPTPQSRDWKGQGQRGSYPEGKKDCLPNAVQSGGQLNPTWVEWLMGYPTGWTDLKDSETP